MIEPRFLTAWEREDYERNKRGESALGPLGTGEILSESAYISGAKAGFKLGLNNDHIGLAALIKSRDGYLKGLKK